MGGSRSSGELEARQTTLGQTIPTGQIEDGNKAIQVQNAVENRIDSLINRIQTDDNYNISRKEIGDMTKGLNNIERYMNNQMAEEYPNPYQYSPQEEARMAEHNDNINKETGKLTDASNALYNIGSHNSGTLALNDLREARNILKDVKMP